MSVSCDVCGREFKSEQSLGLHVWQARRRGTKCSPDYQEIERETDLLVRGARANARIVAALKQACRYGDVSVYGSGRSWGARMEEPHSTGYFWGKGSSLRLALERLVKVLEVKESE